VVSIPDRDTSRRALNHGGDRPKHVDRFADARIAQLARMRLSSTYVQGPLPRRRGPGGALSELDFGTFLPSPG
jgi:hypothetical protein